jgi:hypothetical protein
MAAAPTARPWWHPRPRSAAILVGAMALALAVSAAAPERSAAYDVSVDPSAVPRIPCGTPDGPLVDFWCGTWETDPPTLSSAPLQAFPPFGLVRLERISKQQSDLLKGKPFGDVTITPACGSRALHYAGVYEGGQIVACTAGEDEDEVLEGVYREDATGDLRSGSFRIHLSDIARVFVGTLHQTASGTPDNGWSGRCEGGWCTTVRAKPKCKGQVATIIAEENPLGGPAITFGTPKGDVIVGTPGDDRIFAGGGHDLVCGGVGDDVIVGGGGDDDLHGEAGGDRLLAGLGEDEVDPGPGNDIVKGGDGEDTVRYQSAARSVTVNLASRSATGRGAGGVDLVIGIEAVVGSRYDDRLIGTDDDDELRGEHGDDTIRGLAGDDELFGHEGRDALDGGAGGDVLYGGQGLDRCFRGELLLNCEIKIPAA